MVFSALFALAGCGAKGSCDRRATGTTTCEDSLKHGEIDEIECKSNTDLTKRGAWSTKACDRTGAIGGCETSYNRVWYYPGSRASKIEQVAALCPAEGHPIGVDGKKVTVTPEKPSEVLNDRALMALGAPYKAQLDGNVVAFEKIRTELQAPAALNGTVRLTGGKHVMVGATTAAVWDRDLQHFLDPKPLDRSSIYTFPKGHDLFLCGRGWKLQDRQAVPDDSMKRVFEWCAGLTTLAVVTSTDIKKPVLDSATKQFQTGHATGTVYVFELPSGKLAGGYPYKAENSDEVKTKYAKFGLDSDLTANLGKALTTGLQKADPGSTYVFSVE